MSTFLDRRRSETKKRIIELRKLLARAEELCSDGACVYMTGSFARGEASPRSDLDLFIASRGTRAGPSLRRLDEVLIKADLIEATRKLNIPDFSGDGEYLVHYPVKDLTKRLGTQEDDVSNTFTARLLLLLESSPLLGSSAYHAITDQVIAAYWKDYKRHKEEFMPAFLANDILRMWRTFCVNYEARTQNTPPERRAKRRLMNYKLKHSRLLTCYSAVFYLLALYRRNKTVRPGDVAHMISLSPTERLELLLSRSDLVRAHTAIKELLRRYENFLQLTDASKSDLLRRFGDKALTTADWESAYKFGDLVLKVLDAIGNNNRFYRLLVV